MTESMQTLFREVFDKKPSMLDDLTSLESKTAAVLSFTASSPVILHTLLDSLTSSQIIDLIHTRGDVFGDMLGINPAVLKEVAEQNPELVLKVLERLAENPAGLEAPVKTFHELLVDQPWLLDLGTLSNAVEQSGPLFARNILFATLSAMDADSLLALFAEAPSLTAEMYDHQLASVTQQLPKEASNLDLLLFFFCFGKF